MKFKTLLKIAIISFATFFITSCDDDITTIGAGIQPENDDILLDVDEVFITAETVSLNDNMYLRTDGALLGELNDPTFKNLKAEFLAEFFSSGNSKFELGVGKDATIDSVVCHMVYLNSDFIGDSISPMGISIYEVTKPLKPNFYTNIDPSEYCDMNTLLGQRFFSPRSLPAGDADKLSKYISIELNREFGQNLYDKWKKDPAILKNSKNLKEVLKGIYVTSNFNNKGITEILQTGVNIYYSYTIRNVANTKDSTAISFLSLPVTQDVLQMNKIINSPMAEIDGIGKEDRSFIKAPAGVATKLTIPLAQIKKKAKEKTKSDNFTINSATFKLVAMTEEEENLKIKNRPGALLFINQDSIKNFFLNEKMADARTSLVMIRDIQNNTYNFATGNAYTVDNNIAKSIYARNNIAALINHYIKENPDAESLEYLLIPVSQQSSMTSQTAAAITEISNLLTPSTSILRTKKEHMKMSLIFSKHNASKPR